MRRTFISIRSIGEFIGFLVIIIGGGITTAWVSEQFTAPVREIISGLVLILVAMAGVWWLVNAGPDSEAGRSSSLAGLGGALGVLVVSTFTSGEQYIAVGAAIGAGVCATIGIIWARQSSGRNQRDIQIRVPSKDNTRGGLLITAMFGLGLAVGIFIGNAYAASPPSAAVSILVSSLLGILIGIGLFNRRTVGNRDGYRTITLPEMFK